MTRKTNITVAFIIDMLQQLDSDALATVMYSDQTGVTSPIVIQINPDIAEPMASRLNALN